MYYEITVTFCRTQNFLSVHKELQNYSLCSETQVYERMTAHIYMLIHIHQTEGDETLLLLNTESMKAELLRQMWYKI